MFKLIDSYQSATEMNIDAEDDLRTAINSFLRYGTRVVILNAGKGGYLTVGIGNPYGFVQFTKNDNESPYLIARNVNCENDSNYIEFDAGGTPTPIPMCNCLPCVQVIEIAVYFYKNCGLPSNILWQEV